ncbi:SDR family oxidoreductase [Actinomycetospora corticicola]|uniref:Thioester reductase-like protein/short-subunit dehydrogenase n=1 Tax=Actinomycetospora corticicola TaxID=663602 RepID=A0A7Y9E299_9PSEU|nr:SDR family oxidoreductase [Actinomycetospora corticicola]NYD39873.1 thioester reductase-like protein/short-subunit dehydrogenase [Actinomycetospora corticicola]
MRYLVTGGTGFLGRAVLARLLEREDCEAVHALVRRGSVQKLRRRTRDLPGVDRLVPVTGDLTKDRLGLDDDAVNDLAGQVDEVLHLGAIYDVTADEEANRSANVDGTRNVVALAAEIGARCFHHVSSVAVAGEHEGVFTEDDFDLGQRFGNPYHETKFAAEKIVREESTIPWRVYRPAIVVGDSRTGEIDKIDGPYYLMGAIGALGRLPGFLRLPAPELGATNIVPVDYVADAMVALVHTPDLDGRAFHLVNPRPQPLSEIYNGLAGPLGAPKLVPVLPPAVGKALTRAAGAAADTDAGGSARDIALAEFDIPPEVLPHLTFPCVYTAEQTVQALDGMTPPEFGDYAPVLVRYWREHLDPNRARRKRPGPPLLGRRVVITGASSGIGRETAIRVARNGGVPLLVARRQEELDEVRLEIEREGGQAHTYTCDITDAESVDATVKSMLADHAGPDTGIDMLVNNAGRSIRRSVKLELDRFHDFERTMAINYFGAIRLTMALLPHMIERRFGHVVDISSIGVQTGPPRFSAYVASKAALDAWARIVATEVIGDGVTFTTVHMPLVRTDMIAPTKIYDAFPTLSPEEAADMVVNALIHRPKHVGTALGTLGAVSASLTPRIVDVVMHVAYRVFPESRAAREGSDELTPGEDRALQAGPLSRGAQAFARLLPGVHW